MTLRFSVITAVRNRAESLARCLDSAQELGVRQVVVDGGSSDGSLDIIAARAPRLHWWCSEPDHGIADAFNKGLLHADGDIVGILNADDWYEPNTFHCIRRAFSDPETDVVHGHIRYWVGPRPVRIARGDHRSLIHSGSINHPTVFVRRHVYDRFGPFDTSYRYAMDYELMLRWLVSGVRFRYLPMVLANMSLGGVSDTRRHDALREVRRAQRLHLGRPVADAQYLWLMARYRMRQTLDTLGLQRLVAWQRNHSRGMRSVGAPQ